MICVVVRGFDMTKSFWKQFIMEPTIIMMFICTYLLVIAEYLDLTGLSHTIFFIMWTNIFTYVWWMHITNKGYKPLITKLLP